ncbi:MAG: hypothetical protein ACKPKP_10840 [Dolichospermum sp.]
MLLPITHYPLPITHYPLPITHYPLPITHYPLPITHYPLPITHYPLPTSSNFPELLWPHVVQKLLLLPCYQYNPVGCNFQLRKS